jgi:hypothetical protein
VALAELVEATRERARGGTSGRQVAQVAEQFDGLIVLLGAFGLNQRFCLAPQALFLAGERRQVFLPRRRFDAGPALLLFGPLFSLLALSFPGAGRAKGQ